MLDCRTGGRDDIYRNEYAGEFVWTKENHATIRMLGTEEKAQTHDAGIELGDLLKYISGMGSTK